MSNNFIIFITFIIILVWLFSIAISLYIVKEKGRKTSEGIILGMFPLIGHIIAAFLKPTNNFLIKEMYQRDLITKRTYDQTIEIKLDKINKK